MVRINQWVSDKTHEKIPQIITEIPPYAVLYLINAIYFNGTWSQEFNPESTREMMFCLPGNEYVSTDMMGRVDTVNYLSNESFSAIQLSYGEGNFMITLLLPHIGKTVADITAQMSLENWEAWQ